MVRNRQRTTDRCKWNQEAMASAIKAVKVDKMMLQTAAKTFNVPRNTLRRRVFGDETLSKFGNRTALGQEHEEKLVEHLLKSDKINSGLTLKDLRELVYDFVSTQGIRHRFNNDKKEAGYEWCREFLKRHKTLSVRVGKEHSHEQSFSIPKCIENSNSLALTNNKADILYNLLLELLAKTKK